ncbi:DNA binding domain protein [Microbacterium phage Zeta1847]|uniref:DNA binding domain protein n=1 Tax=Microbacterium phage Zeta1847 TaxID=2201444 RepID=A0A2Z4Q9L7_9CAUD|nr:DNA binding domain protein [Microbacterium phage Zeta1847]AWY06681.1 DNA binding domain protein [Microbacterium phage Zeta1847]
MSHSRAYIKPDSLPVLVVAVVITTALGLSSFLLSYAGLTAAAEWANVPPWLAWAIPVTFDGAILVYTLAALVFRARGESARLAWLSLSLFTGLSVVANGLHAWDAAPEVLRTVLGIIIAGLAPVAVLLTTHTLARLIVARPDELDEPEPEAEVAEWDTRELTPYLETIDDAVAELTEATATPPAALVSSARIPSRPATLADTKARDARIAELAAEGKSLRAIAAEVRCSKSTVARVLGRPAEEAAEPATLKDTTTTPRVLA